MIGKEVHSKVTVKVCKGDILFTKNLIVYCDETFCTQNTSILTMVEKCTTTIKEVVSYSVKKCSSSDLWIVPPSKFLYYHWALSFISIICESGTEIYSCFRNSKDCLKYWMKRLTLRRVFWSLITKSCL